jgi:hypothetical protein
METREHKDIISCDLCGEVAMTTMNGTSEGSYFYIHIEEHRANTASGCNIEKQACNKCSQKIIKLTGALNKCQK